MKIEISVSGRAKDVAKLEVDTARQDINSLTQDLRLLQRELKLATTNDQKNAIRKKIINKGKAIKKKKLKLREANVKVQKARTV